MFPALWTAKTGLDAQQTKMTVISNNLANVATTGFKRDRAIFEDLIYQNRRQVGGLADQNNTLPSGLQTGTGVRVVATEKIHTQGNLQRTENSLDMAVQGNGYFQISYPDGTIAYTRDGTFQRNAEGEVVTSNGMLLEPAITIPDNATSISIGSDGVVTVSIAGEADATNLGTIQLATFINPAGLEPIGQNLFRETAASGAPAVANPGEEDTGTLLQGHLESSNVNTVEELVGMIETQRAYEMNSKAISKSDEMLGQLTQRL
ncbi:flagellar basal-body rod protein FlgG [Magnetovirga frankeli]|jgi:flagellar basal-body rod protein FlgG|uniref:flagellar basal-body rod protein FlgG n=1 Tax=Magnetovirga frankeli TaxID=947516 RepID=UPI001293ABEB|nr:flagellar basal-body rod protein FlgG [gamma proteobacterium SS-5]